MTFLKFLLPGAGNDCFLGRGHQIVAPTDLVERVSGDFAGEKRDNRLCTCDRCSSSIGIATSRQRFSRHNTRIVSDDARLVNGRVVSGNWRAVKTDDDESQVD